MTLNDSRLQATLDAATHTVRATLAIVAGRVSETLSAQGQSSTRITERDLLAAAQFELRRGMNVLLGVFGNEMGTRISQESVPPVDSRRKPTEPDWQTLSLVDDSEMEERMFADRISQQISHASEVELRELSAYMGSLMKTGRADQDRNPLRAEVIGAALYRAIEAVTKEAESRKLLARELGAAMAKAMPECYTQVLRGLQASGVQPLVLTVRQVEGPGNQLPGINSAYATLSSTRSQAGDLEGHSASTGDEGHYGGENDGYERRPLRGSGSDGLPASSGYNGGRATSRGGPSSRSGPSSRAGLTPVQADAQMMALLRHLSAISSRAGELDAVARTDTRASSRGSVSTGSGELPAVAPAYAADGLTGLMAVNLIRAHREELLQASGGKLDHMVIDVVGSLFDAILSDTRVPPQMARQIARLQLPVLRVALNDSSFFSSRRHPVRRFVNRIASLACAFDDFDEGPGKQFLERVRALVQEIVEGDFDQVDIYTSKLAALEAFIAEQTQGDAESQGTADTLGTKESELRLQQRYTMQLQGALQPMALPTWLSEFLPQVWGQAIVLAVSRDGADSDRAKRYRRVGRDLVMSIMPKGSPALRKKFLMALPPLMKDLNEGLALVGWPETAQRDFFGKLLPAHAESLKGAAQSELDHNMMVKQLETIFNIAVPASETLSAADPVPEVAPDVVASRFSTEEAARVGLVTESAVDWSGAVDIDITADDDTDSGPNTVPGESATARLAAIAVDLDLNSADPGEPSRGPQLFDHVKLGFAYQMHLKDEWQKVRLAHVSAGRSFFVFTRGKRHQETISMTARMLARMCETGRMRAVESTYLMERATHRARKQLAALGTPTRY
ncbi:MAG: DUF1631 family protein [Burkholderiales bacterium]